MTYDEMHERCERIALFLKQGKPPNNFKSEEDHKALAVAVSLAKEAAAKYFGFSVPEKT